MNPSERFSLKALPHGEITILANEENETFHVGLGYRESELLYVEQWNLTKNWEKTHELNPMIVWDIGLGAAFNCGAILDSWKKTDTGHLHLISFDQTLEPLLTAIHAHQQNKNHFPHLSGFDWDKILNDKGFSFSDGKKSLRWDWILGDFTQWVKSSESEKTPAPDFILFDAYSPQKNWDMWTLSLFSSLYKLSAHKECMLSTYSRANGLRTTLLLAGFYVGYGCALGNKEDTTIAATELSSLEKPLPKKWLETIRKSHKSQPHVGTEAGFAPISDEYFSQLEKHPQFN
jgi:tRNA U34 5-methylaminomethyl-2-thiouridine-forming methyltransferase MnmC